MKLHHASSSVDTSTQVTMDFTWPEYPTPVFGTGQGFEDELEQRRSPPYNTETYRADVEMHTIETGQLTSASDYQPAPAHPYCTDMTAQSLECPHAGYNLPNFYSPEWFTGAEYRAASPRLTQEVPHWLLWDDTNYLHNPHLDDMLPEFPVVNAEDTDDFNSYVDESATRRHATTNPPPVSTCAGLPGLGPSFPDHPVGPTLPYGYGDVFGPTASNPFALPPGATPQPPFFPVPEQQRDRVVEMGTARPTYAFGTAVVRSHDRTMYPGGQLDHEEHPSEANTNQTTPFACPTCGKVLCNLAGLR